MPWHWNCLCWQICHNYLVLNWNSIKFTSISCKQNSVLNHKTNKDTTKVRELTIQISFLFGFQSLFLCKVTKLWSNNPNKRNVSVSKALLRQKINPVCYPNLSWHFTQYRWSDALLIRIYLGKVNSLCTVFQIQINFVKWELLGSK